MWRYPALLPRHLATINEVEEVLAEALADRVGVDGAVNPSPRVFVAAALGSLRAAFAWWDESDRSIPVATVLEVALNQLVPDIGERR